MNLAHKNTRRSSRSMALLIAAFGLLVTVSWLTGVFGGSSAATAPKVRTPDQFDAQVMCQQFVTDRLKAPASAVYASGRAVQRERLDGDRYRIRSYVDAQNSFGAQVRTSFDCTVRYTHDEQWSLEQLTTSP